MDANSCDGYATNSKTKDYGCCKYVVDGSLVCNMDKCSGAIAAHKGLPKWKKCPASSTRTDFSPPEPPWTRNF